MLMLIYNTRTAAYLQDSLLKPGMVDNWIWVFPNLSIDSSVKTLTRTSNSRLKSPARFRSDGRPSEDPHPPRVRMPIPMRYLGAIPPLASRACGPKSVLFLPNPPP
ncbi:hypothetical protein MUK42_17639 [Musa troglodytarum]|uniref:Uncharacterized protein n=1 Tax=Musa troglodytarum TaxID=320322 RepID=A0A9E7KYS5_9LILI|nr:hypothetical protein MUK42_17639 [Musa troglodytarum]